MNKIKVFLDEKNLIKLELELYINENGKVCEKCGCIQGNTKNGFKVYFCNHFRNKISKLLKSLNNNILEFRCKELNFTKGKEHDEH